MAILHPGPRRRYSQPEGEAAHVSMGRGVNKGNVEYASRRMLLSLVKRGILARGTRWIHLEDMTLSEISQTQKREDPAIPGAACGNRVHRNRRQDGSLGGRGESFTGHRVFVLQDAKRDGCAI